MREQSYSVSVACSLVAQKVQVRKVILLTHVRYYLLVTALYYLSTPCTTYYLSVNNCTYIITCSIYYILLVNHTTYPIDCLLLAVLTVTYNFSKYYLLLTNFLLQNLSIVVFIFYYIKKSVSCVGKHLLNHLIRS